MSLFAPAPEERPVLRDAAIGLAVCTVLAFGLTALIERSGVLQAPVRRFRKNAPTAPPTSPYAVVIVEDRGDWFGRVVVRETGEVVFETMREASPFVAKKRADARLRSLDASYRRAAREDAAAEARAKVSRVTSTGTVIALVTPRRHPKPKK